jgi:protein-S-isoprenylcysteine O-methyltransferase Ste14
MIEVDIIILNVILFFLFALVGSLEFRKKGEDKAERRARGASIGIIIAENLGFSQRLLSMLTFIGQFYVAMQGLAASAYVFTIFLDNPEGYIPQMYLPLLEILGIIIFVLGGVLVVFGWDKIFKAKGQALVKDGLYSHVRHPQYTGILIATLGLIVFRFSPISLALWPILAYIYYRLARKEEKRCEEKFGDEFREWKRQVPMFLPRIRGKTTVAPVAPIS